MWESPRRFKTYMATTSVKMCLRVCCVAVHAAAVGSAGRPSRAQRSDGGLQRPGLAMTQTYK